MTLESAKKTLTSTHYAGGEEPNLGVGIMLFGFHGISRKSRPGIKKLGMVVAEVNRVID